MVRGNPGCPRFCKGCEADCICETYGCGVCHTCKLKIVWQTATFSSETNARGCPNYQHECQRGEMENTIDNMRKFPTLFSSEIVEIVVGKTSPVKRFVPKGALIEHAEYFKCHFSFGDKAGNESGGATSPKVLILDSDVDIPDAFDCFIQFMYWTEYQPTKPGAFSNITLHSQVYVLAERLQSAGLKQLAVRKASALALKLSSVMKNFKLRPTPEQTEATSAMDFIPQVLDVVYSNTPSGTEAAGFPGLKRSSDPFRKLLTFFSASLVTQLKYREGFEECLRTLPDFAVDIISALPKAGDLKLDADGCLAPMQLF